MPRTQMQLAGMKAIIVPEQGDARLQERFVPAKFGAAEFGPDHVGGDVQASDAWSARCVWTNERIFVVRTAYAYAVGTDEAGERIAVGDAEPHHYEIDVMLDEVTCTDQNDPGSSAITDEMGCAKLPYAKGSYKTVEAATAACQRVIWSWLSEQPHILFGEISEGE